MEVPSGGGQTPPSRNGKEMGKKKTQNACPGWSFFEPVAPDALALAVFCVFSVD